MNHGMVTNRFACLIFTAKLWAMPSLIVKNEKGKRYVPLEGIVSIGRHPQNTICIEESEISKQHARIKEVDGKYIYEDLNSANGSYHNELRIVEHHLTDGDTIRIGHSLLIYEETSTIAKGIDALVHFESFDGEETTEFRERVEVNELERFQPEKEVHDVHLLRNDYEKLRLGQELLQNIGLLHNVSELMTTLAKELAVMFAADRCVLLLTSPFGEFKTKAVYSVEKLDEPIAVSKSVLREVQATKNAVLLSNNQADYDIAQVSSLYLMGISSVMCTPIIHDDEVIGAIHLDLKAGKGEFVKKDLQLLGGISSYVAMAVANTRLTKKIANEIKMQAQFERLLSPSIVKQLVSGRLTIGEAGELREVTIMFVDIRGFTQMSQKSSPEAVVSLLNEYFERVVQIVFKYGGTVDKFMGDGVMVLFGAPIPMKQQADAATSCALEIQAMMSIWNKKRLQSKRGLIPVGIGINCGEVVVGSIGSTKTMQYTCIGNAVNIASRLTGIAKAGQVIVSHESMKSLQSKMKFNSLPPQTIKGIAGKVQAYEIIRVLN